MKNQKELLIKGTLQLAAAGIFARLLGLGNRMVLSRMVGAEGLGLFQMVLPIYALLAVTAGLGLPGAVTKMVADRHAGGDSRGQMHVRLLATRHVFIAAVVSALILWTFLALPLELIPDRRIILPLRLMPPAFFFAAISSILRGYYQGRNNMMPTAVSQIGEQVVRLSVGLAAAYYLMPRGLDYALAGIVCGIIAGEIACYIVLFMSQKEKVSCRLPEKASPEVIREMYRYALPILLIRLSTSITQSVESLVIPHRLQSAGFNAGQATALFGQFSGMAMPLLFLPTVLIIPLNISLVPAVAGAVTLRLRHRLNRLISITTWGTLAVGAASALVLYGFAPYLSTLLYGSPSAAPLVAQLAPVAPFAYLQFTTAAILHGMGHPGIAVTNDLAGTLLALFMIYHLTAIPAWGINGVVCAYTVAFTLITLLDCICIFYLARRV